MNQLVLFVGEDQNLIQKLINYLKDDQGIENIDLQEFQSTQVNQIRILKSKTSYSKDESIHIVYSPSICYQNEELLFVLNNITQFCQQLKLIICLDDDGDIQEKTQNISQNIAKKTFSLISENIFFLMKNSTKQYRYQQNIIYFDERNFNKKDFITFLKKPCKLKKQMQSSQLQQFFPFQQIYQFSKGEDLLYLFDKCINNESEQQLNLQNYFFTNILVIFAILNNYQYNNIWKNQFRECIKCQIWIEDVIEYSVVLNLNGKQVNHGGRIFQNQCQICSEKLSQKYYQAILTQLNKKILLDYFMILDQFMLKQQTLSSQSVLILNNEILSQATLFKRLYPNINESKEQFTIGSDISNQFYLISAPEFEFSFDQEEVLSQYQRFLKLRKINFIILCINFQRYDLMKQRVQEMLKFLNGVNRLQIGLFIFCENPQEHQFEKVFSGLKNFFGQIQTISENDGFANIFDKINSVLSEGISYPEINFQNTLFQSDEDDGQVIQENYKQLTKNIEQNEIKNLTLKIEKEKENQKNINYEIDSLKQKIYDLENQRTNSIYQMKDFQRQLTSLQQYQQQNKGQQKKKNMWGKQV